MPKPFAPWFAARPFVIDKPVVAVEVSGVRHTDAKADSLTTCPDDEAEFFSVYLRLRENDDFQPASCVADVADRATAEAYARTLRYAFHMQQCRQDAAV